MTERVSLSTETLWSLLLGLWSHIAIRRRRQFLLLTILMVISSFTEILSIGAVLPFLGILTSPEWFFSSHASRSVITFIGINTQGELLVLLTIAFGGAALLAGFMRLLLIWATTKLSFSAGADLSIEIYRRTLYQPYTVHCARNSSEVISAISTKTNAVIYNIILPIIILISSLLMLVAILLALILINTDVALGLFGGFALIYLFIIGMTRKRLLVDGECISKESNNIVRCLQEGLGAVRDVLVNGSQNLYCQAYRNADLPLRKAQGNNFFVSQSPRYAIEALGMVLIALLAYYLGRQPDGLVKAVPILGTLAFGAQRLLPILQQGYSSISNIIAGKPILLDTLKLLNQPLPSYLDQATVTPISFEREIRFKKVSFRYNQDAPYIVQKLDLTIPKGSRVGIIGVTGSGKSTLVDLLMALLYPVDGVLEIDGRGINEANSRTWQAHIAHVPQTIFLSDDSIEQNIAFGVPKSQIDHELVKLAAERAQLAGTIEAWPKQYQTFVGERGIRLSGGQRQRIAIARALYKRADVIIFDEATSALDNETEQAVIEAIEDLSKEITVITVAHRLTTLRNCSQIIELAEGKIKRTLTYSDVLGSS